MDSAVSGLIGSFINLASDGLTNYVNYLNTANTNRANLQIAREQNQWNLDMWNRQNAYNDPSAQMARLRAAGINPALAYANGGLMNEAAPAQEAAGATMQAPRIQPYYNDPLMMAQIANLNADTHEKESRVPVNEASANQINELANKTAFEAKKVGIDLSVAEQTLPSTVAAAIAKNNFTKEEADAAVKYVNETAKAKFDILQQELENLRSDGKLSGKIYEQKVEELRSLKAKATIDEYNAEHVTAAFVLDHCNSLWDYIALGVLSYKDALEKVADKLDRMGLETSPQKGYYSGVPLE